jgi:hypothetical protein
MLKIPMTLPAGLRQSARNADRFFPDPARVGLHFLGMQGF